MESLKSQYNHAGVNPDVNSDPVEALVAHAGFMDYGVSQFQTGSKSESNRPLSTTNTTEKKNSKENDIGHGERPA